VKETLAFSQRTEDQLRFIFGNMGIDVGFDLYPPLKLKHSDVDQWSRFLQAVCTEFASDAVVVVKEDEIEFQAGEHPTTLYTDPTRFRRFSSKVSGQRRSIAFEPYIEQVYAIA
jgi:hypothetical protein